MANMNQSDALPTLLDGGPMVPATEVAQQIQAATEGGGDFFVPVEEATPEQLRTQGREEVEYEEIVPEESVDSGNNVDQSFGTPREAQLYTQAIQWQEYGQAQASELARAQAENAQLRAMANGRQQGNAPNDSAGSGGNLFDIPAGSELGVADADGNFKPVSMAPIMQQMRAMEEKLNGFMRSESERRNMELRSTTENAVKGAIEYAEGKLKLRGLVSREEILGALASRRFADANEAAMAIGQQRLKALGSQNVVVRRVRRADPPTPVGGRGAPAFVQARQPTSFDELPTMAEEFLRKSGRSR